MSKVLVTGATGFVGAAVARKLLARGDSVRLLARPGSDRRNLEGLDAEIVLGDLRDAASLKAACQGIGGLYHVAADYRLWVPKPAEIYRNNVDGTRDILRAAAEAGATEIVYTSSVAVLGLHKDGTPGDETSPVTEADMIGHYKRSKYRAEKEVDRLVAEEGVPAIIVNPSTPVGPRDVRPTPTGRMIADAASGKMPAYVDTGLNIVHVDDVADGHLQAAAKGKIGERYVLGGENLTLREIFTRLAAISGRRPPRVRLPHATVWPVALCAETWARLFGGTEPIVTREALKMARKWMFFSSDKAKRELGYAPRPADEALRDAVAWFRANGYVPAAKNGS
jgi:dihydroflavonol-4-reductase